MRKTLCSLFALLTIAVSAMAQVETNKLFTSTNSRATWMYDGGLKCTTSYDEGDAKQQFALIEFNEALYIWSQAGENFLNNVGQAVGIMEASPVQYSTHDGTYFFHFTDAAGKYINVNTVPAVVIDTWSTADAGNKQTITYVEGIDMDFINSKIPSTYTITWNITGVGTMTTSTLCASGEMPSLPELPAYIDAVPTTELVAASADATYTLTTSYNSSMPFQLGGENYYTLKMNRAPAIDIFVDPEDNTKINTKNEAIKVLTQDYYKWQFDGNWVDGFTLKNKATQTYVTYGSSNPEGKHTAELTDTPAEGAYFDLVLNGGHNYLKIHGTTNNAYVSNNGGAGTTFLTNWNSANNIGDAGAQILIAEAEELTQEAVVTYTIMFDGVEVDKVVTNSFVGKDMPAVTLPYGVEADYTPSGKIASATVEQTINCTVADDAPFQYSADYEHAKWYTLTIRGTKYPAYNGETGHVANGTVAPTEETLAAKDLFAFVGTPWGLKIINGATGADKALGCTYGDGAKYEAVDLAEGMSLKFENNEGHLVFAIVGHEAAHVNDVNNELGIWTYGGSATDGGSSFTFAPVDDAVAEALLNAPDWASLDAAIAAVEAYTIGTGLGEYTAEAGFETALAAAKTMNTERTAGKAEVEAAVESINADKLTINEPAEGFYRFKGAVNGRYITAANGGESLALPEESTDDAAEIFYVQKVGDKFTILSYKNGLYSNDQKACNVGEEAGQYSFQQAINNSNKPLVGQYWLQTNNAQNDVLQPWNNGVVQISNSHKNIDNQSGWVLEQVVYLPVTISEAGYATFYAPVALTVPFGLEAYTVAESEGRLVATAVAEGNIAANTAVILKGEAGDYLFKPASEVPAQSSCLTGTIATIDAPANCYTLAVESEKAAFYSYTGATVQGFKAYFEKASDVKGFALSFSEADAIQAVEMAQKADMFDLSGRKAAKAQKGIFIQNGKKVVK